MSTGSGEAEAAGLLQALEVAAAHPNRLDGGVAGFLVVAPLLVAKVPEAFLPTVLSFTLVPALALAGLAWWARRQPARASLAAVGLYAVWTALQFALHADIALRWLPISIVLLALLGWTAWVGNQNQAKRQTG